MTIACPIGTTQVNQVELLAQHFSGWETCEIPERMPILGIVEDGNSVSVCFCARSSDVEAEAGVETAAEHHDLIIADAVDSHDLWTWGRL